MIKRHQTNPKRFRTNRFNKKSSRRYFFFAVLKFEGEISNCKPASSGNAIFNFWKDNDAQIRRNNIGVAVEQNTHVLRHGLRWWLLASALL